MAMIRLRCLIAMVRCMTWSAVWAAQILRKTTRSPEQHSPQALLTKLPIGRPKAKTILMGLAHWIPPRHRVHSIVR
ncbi:Uncharacterised protein [Vibrio cholerae]|nr:Uncharacterised protein [Vibrio cholerae]